MIREAFFETASAALALIASPEVARAWNDPSALPDLTVGALAAHLGRGISTVEFYLAVTLPDPLPTPIGADQYYVDVRLTRDIHDELNTSIRERSMTAASAGHSAAFDEIARSLAVVSAALAVESPDRFVAVMNGMVMTLDEYLVTRLVELTVHIDDLAISVAQTTPDLPEVARARVLSCLLAIARRRHGDTEVLRALTRAERTSRHVFPVL